MGRKNDTKNEDDDQKVAKVDTRYYDELFTKIKDQESDEFNDAESLEALYSTILDQISEEDGELKKCIYSYHIDYFLYKSSLENFTKFFSILTSDSGRLEHLLADTRTSRAYEACLMLIGNKTKTSSHEESLKKCMLNLGDYFVSNLENILETHNGIFSLRSFLRVIGSPDILEAVSNETNKKKHRNQEFNIKNVCVKIVPQDWNLDVYIKKFSKSLKEMNLLEIGLDAEVSPFISLLLRKMFTNFPDKCSSIIDKIHKQFAKKPNSFHSMIQDAKGSRFIESFLLSSHSEILTIYLNDNILPNVVTYSKHIYANYPIQTLIKHRMEKEQVLVPLFDSLVENLPSIIDLNTDLIFKNYLIVELIEVCRKNSSLNFKNLIKTILDYFGLNTEENKIHVLRALLVYQKLDQIQKESPIDQVLFVLDLKPIASTIAVKLIEKNDKTINKSFNSLNSNELEYLATNSVGSHFVQQVLNLCQSKDKNDWIQSIFDRLRGRFVNISRNKSGSFVMETLWSVGTLKQRLMIVDELKMCEQQLKNDQYAKFLVNKVGLNFYKRKPDEWKQIQTNELKKKRLFSDIITDSNENKKKIKK
ncbi:nucleolar 9 [Brachionus plicatilis]|uniref:Nucleolar 9 n=1 Tax=Brachionus plicatilis TaxID=10195 RepID=A0A3M7R878_BRAPC|nr:nucleolar 9 [Brachionus plicatilis]